MTVQNSVAVRDGKNDSVETNIGVSPIVRLYNGTKPADCAAALSGNTLLAQGTLPSDWMAASSAGVKAKSGSWTLTGQSGAGAGTAATFYRIFNSGDTVCHEQGTAGANTVINTNGATAANSNVLNFAATTGVAVGQQVSGTGIPADTKVLAFTGTTVTLDKASSAGVSNGASITFGYDMVLDNNNIANAQSLNVATYQKTAGNP